MFHSPSTAWYRATPYSPEVSADLAHIHTATKTYREQLIAAQYLYEFAYHRDQFLATGGGRLRLPTWLQEYYETDALPAENIVKGRIDNLVSLLMTEQPAVEVKVAGATFEAQRAARARSDALNALFNTDAARKDLRTTGRAALIAGAAFARPVVRNGSVRLQTLRLDQVTWDSYDAKDGDPTFVMVDEYIDRAQLLTWIAHSDQGARRKAVNRRRVERAQAVKPQPPYKMQSPYLWYLTACQMTSASDRLHIRHAWRVASSIDAEDGRYVCVLVGGRHNSQYHSDAVLFDRPFNRTTLPLVWFSPWPPDDGIVGVGYAAQVFQVQRAMDYHWHRIEKTSEQVRWTNILVPSGAVNDEQIENFAEQNINVIAGAADDNPVVVPPPPGLLNGDIEYLNYLRETSANVTGVNQVLAGGQTQLGAGASGVALAEEADRQVDRMSDVYENWSSFRLDVARELLHAIEDAVRMDGSFSSAYRAESGAWRKHDWEDLTRPTETYDLGLEEAGQLARTRAGRTAKIIAQAEQGNLDPADARRALLSTPDLRRIGEMALAGRRRIESDLDELTIPNGDRTRGPTPDHDLKLAVRLSQDMINHAANEGAEPETLERLAEYRRAAQALLQQELAAQATAQVAAAGAAQAVEQTTQAGVDAQAAELMTPGAPQLS